MANNGAHAHNREVKAVARSEDNKFLVSASVDGSLKVWDLSTERHIATMKGHLDEVARFFYYFMFVLVNFKLPFSFFHFNFKKNSQ